MQNRFTQWGVGAVASLWTLALGSAAQAQVTVFAQDLSGFNAAAGNPPISIDFDGIAPGTDIGSQTIAGVLFQALGSPLIVVRGADTTTVGGYSGVLDPDTNKLFPTSGENVLSPGGTTLGPGPDAAIEQDSLQLTFATPLTAFGFDHLSQSADGFSFTSIQVFDTSNALLFSGTVPISNINGQGGGAPGGADFWGIVSQSANIARIVINEGDGDSSFPDNNIGYDTFRFVPSINSANAPEPATASLLTLCLIPLAARLRRR